jgi:hypothetical protein
MRRLVCLLAVCALGCNEDRLPTPAPSPTPVPPAGYRVMGWVYDTAAHPLADVRIEVVEGARAGESVTTDAQGQYRLPGVFTGAVSLLATKSGYLPLTKRAEDSSQSQQYVTFALVVDGPTADITGNSVVTITADASCREIPDTARVRSYSATVGRVSSTLPYSYVGILGGATFFPSTQNDRIYLPVAGDVARFLVDPYEDGVIIAEEVAPSTYVSIWGIGDLSVTASGLSGLIAGEIAYCTNPARSNNYSCLTPDSKCQSTSHRVAFVRQ